MKTILVAPLADNARGLPEHGNTSGQTGRGVDRDALAPKMTRRRPGAELVGLAVRYDECRPRLPDREGRQLHTQHVRATPARSRSAALSHNKAVSNDLRDRRPRHIACVRFV